ncbi:MAG: hypothetical protein ACRD2J_12710 [Thermoanaerobaculia bacterium]
MSTKAFFPTIMRRFAAAAIVLVLASVGPTAVIAGVCATDPSCCKAAPADQETLSRGSCCPTTCIEPVRETDEATVSAVAPQGDPLRTIDVPATASAPAVASPVQTAASASSPPSTGRRLAALSVLLI